MRIRNMAPALRMESFGRLHKTHQGLASQTINNQNAVDRKRGFRLATALAIIPLMIATGCSSLDIRHAETVATADVADKGAPKGYVEFYSTAHDAPVPILLDDDPENARPLGAIGLKRGDKYSHSRYGIIMGEKLRVALPPGDHMFRIEGDGESIKVPVVEGQVTPVEIDYMLVERGDTFVVYRLNHRVLGPTALKETAMAK
jgi:hypothetical protein